MAARDAGPAGDRKLVAGLFSEAGRRDPQAVLRGSAQAGCRYAVARGMLHSANFVALDIGDPQTEMFRMFKRWLIAIDGDRHRALRRAFGGEFAPRRVGAYRESIERTAGALIDAVASRGSMDLVGDFARPLPLAIVCRVLGVPGERIAWVDERMVTLGLGFANQRDERFVAAASEAVVELQAYFGELLDERRRVPREDLMSRLASELPEDPETRADVLANCVFFISAGHVTTTSLIAAGVLLLLENPGHVAALVADEAALSTAVEEMLRMVTPTSVVVTRALQPETIEDCAFAAGEQRFVFLAAANRDPSAFPEPDRFDPARSPNPHLTFSAGKHFCLGAPLARLHGEVAIPTLLRRLPGLRLDGAPVWRGSIPLRELESLPVAWSSGKGTITGK